MPLSHYSCYLQSGILHLHLSTPFLKANCFEDQLNCHLLCEMAPEFHPYVSLTDPRLRPQSL